MGYPANRAEDRSGHEPRRILHVGELLPEGYTGLSRAVQRTDTMCKDRTMLSEH